MIQDEDSRLGGKPAVGWTGLHGNWETGTWPYTGLFRKEKSGNVLKYTTIIILNRHVPH